MTVIRNDGGKAPARGRVGPRVYCMRAGTAYHRRYTKQVDANTAAQKTQREKFKRAKDAWRSLDEITREIWRLAAARGLGRSGYLLFVSAYLKHDGAEGSLPLPLDL